MKKKICILYTGGTIGMVSTKNGYAPKAGYLYKELGDIAYLQTAAIPKWDLIELNPLLDSLNIAVEQWNEIGQSLRNQYANYDGFVVLHGGGTMAYTAAALSFMLEGLSKPVVVTGSQISLCQIRSDARDNLITSMLIAGEGQASVFFLGGQIDPGKSGNKGIHRWSNCF